jgi:hypothetical protein
MAGAEFGKEPANFLKVMQREGNTLSQIMGRRRLSMAPQAERSNRVR